MRAFPTADGGISVFFRDVTAVKGVEDRLSSARGFEQKIVAIVGHDILNPLGAIELAAGRILRQDAARDPAIIHKSAQLIERAVERIQHIVDGLLDFTRARQGGIPIKLEKTSLDIICKEIIEELTSATADRTVDFECEGDVVGYWDPHRLAQAVSNLVGNAFQHSEPDSRIRVTVRPDVEVVTLDVHNEGAISADVLPTIFDPFRQGLKQQKNEGLGLGLYIADTIVRAHDGQMRCIRAPATAPPSASSYRAGHTPTRAAPPNNAYYVSGSSTVNVAPSPGALSTAMVPPCASTTCLTMNSPRPSPPKLLDEAARSKRSKMRA